MAAIKHKNNRRYRVQFTMERELHETYQEILARASERMVVVDFGCDFDVWFRNQLDQVKEMLERLDKSQCQYQQICPDENISDVDTGIHQTANNTNKSNYIQGGYA
ncbi:MAG: hypothetical protein U1D97_14965 [Desulfuromonadales bacterium]|nr:hypothetical protein [Desulfuromonadales bacterium]